MSSRIPSLRRVLWFTLWQATLSTAITLVVGLPAAYCFARLRFVGKRVIWALLIVPFVLPTVVVASAVLGVVGPRSPVGVDLKGSIWAILLAHVLFNYAVVVRTVGAFWSNLDPALEEAARVAGASQWRAFREVTWPLLRPAVLAASSIVFLFTFTSFGVVLLLGGPGFNTLEVEIYTQTTRLLRLDTAAALGDRAVRGGARGAARLLDLRPSPHGGVRSPIRERDEPRRARHRPAAVPRGQPPVHGAAARRAAGRVGVAVVRLRFEPVLVALQRPRLAPSGGVCCSSRRSRPYATRSCSRSGRR